MGHKMAMMKTTGNLKGELSSIKKALLDLKNREDEMQALVNGKGRAEDAGSHLLKLVEFVMAESKTTKALLANINNQLARLEGEMENIQYVEQDAAQAEEYQAKEIPLSGLDVKILQFIQLQHSNMACAEDIKEAMGYKGKNAASARLNRLYKQGILDRYQLGHKVFYRYDAGSKTTKTLIVSPPQ